MNGEKRFILLLLIILVITGGCGCMSINSVNGTAANNTDKEYVERMKAYIEDKYSRSFDIVESITHTGKKFSGMETNVLVLRDDSGCITNVRAMSGTPYDFFDDYVQVCTAAKIRSELEPISDSIEALGLYVVTQSDVIDSIDISSANIMSLDVVAKISGEPNDVNLHALYDVYKQLCNMGYWEMYFLVGFVENSDEFSAAVENYSVHGKSNWRDYDGDFHAYLRITSNGLSYDEFVNSVCKEDE